MYEFKHHPSISGTCAAGTFDPIRLRRFAVIDFAESPKVLTLARHADREDVTEIHCYTAKKKDRIDFQVLGQKLVFKYDKNGSRFTVVNVIDMRGSIFVLVVHEISRRGFLLNPYCLTNTHVQQSHHLPLKYKRLSSRRVRVVDGKMIRRL
jgi:hypothetical protein